MHKIGKHMTTISKYDDGTAVTYHNTAVVVFNDDTITLNTGGWFSNTTKTRMNQASHQFDLGYYVFQRAGKWYVDAGVDRIPFDGNTVTIRR